MAMTNLISNMVIYFTIKNFLPISYEFNTDLWVSRQREVKAGHYAIVELCYTVKTLKQCLKTKISQFQLKGNC
ncbi:hypothetical protein D3C86_1971330 [compost metagenome]